MDECEEVGWMIMDSTFQKIIGVIEDKVSTVPRIGFFIYIMHRKKMWSPFLSGLAFPESNF